MDRIRKALEVSSQNKKSNQSTLNQSHQDYLIDKNIEYTQTKNFNVLPAFLKKSRVISPKSDNDVANAYKILRTQILQRMKVKGINSLGVVSTQQGEGKTLTAINLAISLAQEVNHTVLLVDFDLKNPSVHEYLGCQPEFSISDYLLDSVSINEILFTPDIDGLVVLPGNKSFGNSSEVLSSPKVVNLVEELKARYPERIVIFDLPPILSSDDVLAFSPLIDTVLMVVEDGKAGRDDLLQSMDYLKNCDVIGSVLNKSGKRRSI